MLLESDRRDVVSGYHADHAERPNHAREAVEPDDAALDNGAGTMRKQQVRQGTRMATVREGTRMPQSFKNAWRWLVGTSAAAMLIAIISPAASADTGLITLCIARKGKIVGVDIHCQPHNLQLTGNIPGAAGSPRAKRSNRPHRSNGRGGSHRFARRCRYSGSHGADGVDGSDGGSVRNFVFEPVVID